MAFSVRQALDILGMILVSVSLVAKVIINGVVGNGIGPVKNDTGDISDQFQTEVHLISCIETAYETA